MNVILSIPAFQNLLIEAQCSVGRLEGLEGEMFEF